MLFYNIVILYWLITNDHKVRRVHITANHGELRSCMHLNCYNIFYSRTPLEYYLTRKSELIIIICRFWWHKLHGIGVWNVPTPDILLCVRRAEFIVNVVEELQQSIWSNCLQSFVRWLLRSLENPILFTPKLQGFRSWNLECFSTVFTDFKTKSNTRTSFDLRQ